MVRFHPPLPVLMFLSNAFFSTFSKRSGFQDGNANRWFSSSIIDPIFRAVQLGYKNVIAILFNCFFCGNCDGEVCCSSFFFFCLYINMAMQ